MLKLGQVLDMEVPLWCHHTHTHTHTHTVPLAIRPSRFLFFLNLCIGFEGDAWAELASLVVQVKVVVLHLENVLEAGL